MQRSLLIFTVCLGLAACNSNDYAAEERIRGLKTFEIAETERSTERRFPGVLEPSDLNTLSFETAGTLLGFDLDVGQQVKQGEVLAQLDPTSLELQVESSRAGVEQAAAVAQNTANVVARQEELIKSGTTTRANLENAQTEALSAAASLAQAERALQTAEENLTKTELIAPFDGIINSVDASSFQTVSGGTPIATLYDPSAFTVTFSVNFDTADRLVVGTPARIRLADRPDITLAAVVSELGARADAVSSFPVVVTLQEVDPLLKAGMAVEVAIEFSLPAEEGFLVPLSVIIRDGDAPSNPNRDGVSKVGIYAFDPETSTVKRRDVVIGGIRENDLIVLEGLSPGDRIASAGVSFLRDGQTVKLLETDG